MRRRAFITLVGGAAVAWPLAARAQVNRKVYRIGMLLPGATSMAIVARNPRIQAFLQRLRELNWIEGQNVMIEWRLGEGQFQRLAALAAELANIEVDVIVTAAAPAAQAAKEATSTIPVVILDPGDPVGTGLVRSLARPGGNVTGVSSIAPDLSAKRLALLKETVPAMTSVAVLFNAAIPPAEIAMTELRVAAQTLSLRVQSVAVQGPTGLEKAFATITNERVNGLVVLPDPLTFSNQETITNFVLANKIPALFGAREFVAVGGLMSYGPSYPGMFRRGADYVDRILKGANPANLPVEQPSRFELVINLKTAQALGLDVAAELLARADEVIE
jgi:putative tryptophan/tyrosine transport system substrate-binding protein